MRRIALAGIGSAAMRAHLPVIAEMAASADLELVGVCDPDPRRRQTSTRGHPSARGFGSVEEMLAAASPDLLVIATPPSAHLDEIAEAVGAGVHVLCEKPLGLSRGHVDRLGQLACARPDLVLQTVHQYRFAPAWTWLARALRGAIATGEPFQVDVAVERPGTDPLSAGDWRTDPEREGGILGDHAVHYLALMHSLDPRAAVLDCWRTGPGGREVASVQVAVGAAGRAQIDVSYAGERRCNRIAVSRPAHCFEACWEDGSFGVMHNGFAGPKRSVGSLSDRRNVDALYRPVYSEIVSGVDDPAWRDAATKDTLAVAALLADALAVARPVT